MRDALGDLSTDAWDTELPQAKRTIAVARAVNKIERECESVAPPPFSKEMISVALAMTPSARESCSSWESIRLSEP